MGLDVFLSLPLEKPNLQLQHAAQQYFSVGIWKHWPLPSASSLVKYQQPEETANSPSSLNTMSCFSLLLTSLCLCLSALTLVLVWFSMSPFYLRVQKTSWIFLFMSFIKLGQVWAITSLKVPTKPMTYLMVPHVSPRLESFQRFYKIVNKVCSLSFKLCLQMLTSADVVFSSRVFFVLF